MPTQDQNYELQIDALKQAGCKKIFSEKISGTTIDRPELELCLDYLREGGTLLITRIDRLARSLRDLQNLVYDLRKKGIELKAIEHPIETSSAAGKAKTEGKYKRRKPTAKAKAAQVHELKEQGLTKQDIAGSIGNCCG